ncbi:MAG: 3-phosphoshikimate 1-carboxyvinyltransferase, partial [Gammaproteobacteria bacterium]
MVADALIVTPSDLENVTLNVPGDKSLSHRALIISALAEGTTSIHGLLRSEDVEKTRAALQSLGVSINCDQPVSSDTCDFVEGCGLKGLRAADRDINCGNSGTTMRLLAGILAGQIFNSRLTGDVSLQRRPMLRIAEPLRKMGAKIQLSSNNTAPIEFIGMPGLQTIDYKMPVPSAQVKS